MNQPLLKQYNEKDIAELLKNNVHLVYVDTGSEEVVARYEALPIYQLYLPLLLDHIYLKTDQKL